MPATEAPAVGMEWRCALTHGNMNPPVSRTDKFTVYVVLLTFLVLLAAVEEQVVVHAQDATVTRSSKRRVVRLDGDIIIGALFPVHRQPSLKTAFTRQCGPIWEQYGMHRIEIFLRTLDEINNNSKLLPNITLGCDIRDSCWYPPVALEQSIDFIKNSIASVEKQTSDSQRGTGPECRSLGANKPIAGLIGPGSSTVTIQVQNLLSLFNIPQIGYSATSKDLSDKSLYEYFLRVVPSDVLQARAMLDLVRYYNWTYISTVYTEGNYGWRGMLAFQSMAADVGICEASQAKIKNNAEDEAYDKVITTLLDTKEARVVVCFCEGMTVRNLLKAAKRKGAVGRFLFIGSDGWAVRPDVVEDIEDVAAGGISFKLYSPPITDFDEYFFALTPFTNKRNPWFKEFWQQKFECYLEGDAKLSKYNHSCTGHENLRMDYVQDAKLGFVVNAIYTMAYALDNMQRDLCPNSSTLCEVMSPINGTTFLHYLINVSFNSYSNDQINFNAEGDPPGRYDIMNFQPVSINGTPVYEYVKIGGWDSGNLTMADHRIYWPARTLRASSTITIESVCSKPCEKGKVKTLGDKKQNCCWQCTECRAHEFMLDESTCAPCPLGWWPSADLNACLMIDIEHLQWGDTEAVVAMVFACVGIFATIWVTLVFIRHNNTAVVKASTRELSYIILIGITISYSTTFPLVAKPSLITCYMNRILPGFSFSLIYGALVTKTNRIARILAGSKKKIMTRKPRFMSASAQVVITFIIIGIECAIITVMLILEPADSTLAYPLKTRVKLTCNATTMGIIVPLGFDIFLIVLCTLYAIKTRNLPENFNEAKFIGFTMYTTCIIWLAFVPIYFGSDSKVITMCLAITLSATVALVLLFFPKIYIIICKPEKNNRSAFTTSKDVRCHIGSTSGRSFSNSNDSFDRLYNSGKIKSKSATSLLSWKPSNLEHFRDDVRVVVRTKKESPSPPPLSLSSKPNTKSWQEKTFENAALALYRQKNFFNRWKNKSGSPGSESPQRTLMVPPRHNHSTARTAFAHASSSDMRTAASSSLNTHISNAGPRSADSRTIAFDDDVDEIQTIAEEGQTRRYRPNGGSRLGGSSTSGASGGVGARPRVARGSSSRVVDTSVQTDQELLEPLLCTLRRRKVSTVSVGNSPGIPEDNGGLSPNREPSRKSSRASVASSGGRPSVDNCSFFPDVKVAECEETVVVAPHRDKNALLGITNIGASRRAEFLRYSNNEKSPLLAGERSPLLSSADEQFLCDDSTSEETLSERDYIDVNEDLEELLTVAAPLEGSFNSLASSGLDLNKMSDMGASRKFSGPLKSDSNTTTPESLSAFRSFTASPNSNVLFNSNSMHTNKSREDTRKKVPPPLPFQALQQSTNTAADDNGSSSTSTPPASAMSETSFNSLDGAPLPAVDPGYSVNVPRIRVATSPSASSGELTPTALELPGNFPFHSGPRRVSSNGSSAASRNATCPPSSAPPAAGVQRDAGPEQGSRRGSGVPAVRVLTSIPAPPIDGDPDSVAKFQEYLRTRGLDLDLSSVQSSDV